MEVTQGAPFESFGLSEAIMRAIRNKHYTVSTPVQAGCIPPMLAGKDVIAKAPTGTGKTCAFATPILQRLSDETPAGRPIRALILTPTRELAIQIGESIAAYGKNLALRHTVIFGGVGQNPQAEAWNAVGL